MGAVSVGFVKQFGTNIMHLVQQKGSRLRPSVMIESGIVGEEAFFDQLGTKTATKKTTRNSDTPITAPDHARRMVTLFDYEVATLHDKQDQLKMLADPTSRYVQAGAYALGRSMDDEIIVAASGTAKTGKTGATSTTLPSAQKVAHSSVNLTIAKLLAAKEILDAAETDPDEQRFCVLEASQVTDLLNTTEIKSADYNTVKALAAGQLDTFLGFKFIRTQRLEGAGTAGDPRMVLCYLRTGILLAIAQDIVSRIDDRADKSYAKQVYLSLGVGATRMEEEQIVQVACVE